MIGKLIQKIRLYLAIRNGALTYIKITSDEQRQFEGLMSWHHDRNTKKGSVNIWKREIPETQKILYWRFWYETDINQYWESYPKFLYALFHRGKDTGIRFLYSSYDASIIGHCSGNVIAFDIGNNHVFELPKSHYECWSTPEQAILTIYSNWELWRPWQESDQLKAEEAMHWQPEYLRGSSL